MTKWNLGVIGAGNMASAIVKGVLREGLIKPNQIYIHDLVDARQSQLAAETSVLALESNVDVIKNCSIIIMAVKPKAFDELLEEIANHVTPQHIIISIAAGISTQYIRERLWDKGKIVRVMPNTPALIGEGMSVICDNHDLNETEIGIVNSIFLSLGRIESVEEELINGVTAISGSSPAYVYLFIEALADGGVMMGLSRDQAYRMAAQSVLGAAKMVLEQKEHPGVLKDMVCSPGGTTIEAVYSLEKNGFRGAIMEAVRNCALKAEKMDKDSKK